MGQQQLLLLVLGMVIVGIAVVAGIQAFSEGKAKADRDAAISDAMRVISDIQAWKLKPSAFGGGSEAAGFTGLKFSALGITDDGSGNYVTQNGCFSIEVKTHTINGSSVDDAAVLTVKDADNGTCGLNTIATVGVGGTTVGDIGWDYGS